MGGALDYFFRLIFLRFYWSLTSSSAWKGSSRSVSSDVVDKILPWSFVSCQVFWATGLTKPSLRCPKLSPGSGPAQDGEGKWGNQNVFGAYHTGDASRAFWHSFVPCQPAGPAGNIPASPRSSDGPNTIINPQFSRGYTIVEINLLAWTCTRGDGSWCSTSLTPRVVQDAGTNGTVCGAAESTYGLCTSLGG